MLLWKRDLGASTSSSSTPLSASPLRLLLLLLSLPPPLLLRQPLAPDRSSLFRPAPIALPGLPTTPEASSLPSRRGTQAGARRRNACGAETRRATSRSKRQVLNFYLFPSFFHPDSRFFLPQTFYDSNIVDFI